MQYIRTPQEAEANAAKQMRALGFDDAAVTNGGSDGGIDVRSRRALAQVKWRGGMVGRPELQNLYGARAADHSKSLLFFAASGYTQHAKEYADACEIALYLYDPDGSLKPSNRWARTLTGHAVTAVGSTAPVATGAQPRYDATYEYWGDTREVFAKHWRIIGAVIFTLGAVGGLLAVIDLIDPSFLDSDSDGNASGTITVFIFSVVAAPLFWYLWAKNRTKK